MPLADAEALKLSCELGDADADVDADADDDTDDVELREALRCWRRRGQGVRNSAHSPRQLKATHMRVPTVSSPF